MNDTTPSSAPPAAPPPLSRLLIYTMIAVLLAGIALRLYPSAGFEGVGFDENLYQAYVSMIHDRGLGQLPAIVNDYIETQKRLPSAILPPTRFLYIFCGYLWSGASGTSALQALHDVSAFWSILMLGLSLVFAWRLRGPAFALGVVALMSFAPTQIHMAQHALIDGFFAFWAVLSLWLLWECLRHPRHRAWLAALAAALALMVLTKENAFFVYVALLGIVATNKWTRIGEVNRPLLAVLVAGPALGLLVLVLVSGGLDNFIAVYLLLVQKAYTLQYAVLTGDGPWYRYMVDLLLVSPIIFLLTVGACFRLSTKRKPALYLAVFLGASYLIMCNVKFGMNLRYTNMWDMPMRFLAIGQLWWLARHAGRYRESTMAATVAALCAFDLNQYRIFFVDFGLYELVTEGLMRAVNILK